MDNFETLVLIAGGVITLLALSEKIRLLLLKPIFWLFCRPHNEIQDKIETKCVEFKSSLQETNNRIEKVLDETSNLIENNLEKTNTRIKEVSERQESKILEMNAMSFGLLSILHDRIFQACMYFITKDEISCDELENLEYLYKGYAGLNGNGTCETLMNKVRNLKIIN